MYKRRLPSFVAYLLELTACVLALLPENEWNNRSTFNTGNVDLRNIAREVLSITASSTEDVERGMGSYLRVQVRVRMRWTGCEACDLRERRKGWQVFFNLM